MKYLITTVFCSLLFSLSAFTYPDAARPNKQSKKNIFNLNCAQATAQSDLNVNNVRARLLVGGDLWWDGNRAQYIVPQVEPGEPEVSAIFAGAVWMGGFDAMGNLKVAAQQFGTASGNSDYWPGPLTSNGITQAETCENWDNIFAVTGEEIDLHIAQYRQALADNIPYEVSQIPNSVLGWPALGNEFFFEIFDFQLPDAQQGLAPFWDENGDGLYTPQFGDYPIIEIRGCGAPQYADGMQYWIFNDAGNIHTESNADPLQMEIHGQAFAYATDDALNDMTFTRYKLVNRAAESREKTIFGVWLDADLGCSEDDFVGCDTIRDLMYVYNRDALDGSSGSNCIGGVATYSDKVPYLGVDFFRGPLAPKIIGPDGELMDPDLGQAFDTIVEIGMTSFIYFNRQSPTTNPGMTDPVTAQGYYNILSGLWTDGTPLTIGGNGFGGTEVTKFAFHDEPNANDGWSMCSESLPLEDRRTVQSAGPFRLDPGQVNELIIGIPWVPDVRYPCPDMGRLFRADDLAQSMFDSCFDILDGPDAPDVRFEVQDQNFIFELSNNPITSNNANESYAERSTLVPPNISAEESTYRFEGYIVYQLSDENVTRDDLDNPEKARIAFQSDIENEAIEIFNWEDVRNPIAGPFDNPIVWDPMLKVEGKNEGVENTFELSIDLFTGGAFDDQTTYYYMAIAYAFNEYEPFSPVTERGQASPYLEGERNVQIYRARLDGTTSTESLAEQNDALSNIIVSPNLVMTSSNTSNSSSVINISNLPPSSTVTIYNIDGLFIKQFELDGNIQVAQPSTIEWNVSDASIASGTYLVHVQAKGLGQRVFKVICVK